MVQKKWVDETGVSLTTDATADAHRAALRIINSGRLSEPLPVVQMYHNCSKDPLKPDWIWVRGTSKMEGYRPHLEGTSPGTGYALNCAGGIFSMFNMPHGV
ncbi:g8630 [Coccomyxa elongata]